MALADIHYSGSDYDPKPVEGLVRSERAIREMISNGQIAMSSPIADGQVQPASLDLRLGKKAYRVRASFLPGPGTTVAEKLHSLALHEFDLTEGAVLEVGCVYLVPLLESLDLSDMDIIDHAACNPKSSTGRLDVFTRVIADGAKVFDQVEHRYKGPLYAEICPQTFPVLVRTGSRLSQIRFREYRGKALVERPDGEYDGYVDLSVDLAGDTDTGFIGYRAKRHTGVIDMDAPRAYDIDDFWEPIHAGGQTRLILDPDQFYILASKEAVTVPPTHAAEMVPFNPLVGEFRVHYAGFFDPGFGYSGAGGEGAKAVLEVRSHKVPFILEDGQIIGRLIYQPLTEEPDELYGQGIGSNYQAQGLKLSKHFK